MTKFFAKKEYQKIAKVFKIGTIQNLHQFKGGLAAPKVLVKTTRGRFVIAKYKFGKGDNFKNKPRWALQNEVDLLNLLKGLPTPQYVADGKGDFILNHRGFGITVYRFLEGRTSRTFNGKQVFELGRFLGNFHAQGLKLKNRFSKRHKFYHFPPARIREMKIHAYNQTHPKLKSVVRLVEDGIRENSPPKYLPHGPIHVDFKHDNELFKGNTLTGIIDFGNFYRGPLMLDVGKAIIFNCAKNGKLDDKLIKRFLAGYSKYRKLDREEKKYLKRSIRYAIYSHIWLDLYHVPLNLVPETHTLYFVEEFLPAIAGL
ncbi:MAG: phosphotransferase [Candidatus Liptonbacteria bacterium]|nr:phosphotransferase [Candidatus Liptonbacteria bacterium]